MDVLLKKILVKILISFVFLLLIIGFGFILFLKDHDYATKPKNHGSIRVFSADLNHNGVIEENEKNLTWHESFDGLLKQANDYEKLKEFSISMKIVEKDQEIACKLARYEILHQCEELILKSAAIIPIGTDNVAAKKKTHLKDVYFDGLSSEHFDRMYSTKKNHHIKIISGGGTSVTTLDHLIISDSNSNIKILSIMSGLKRFKFESSEKVKMNDTLEDCLRLVLKKINGVEVTYYVFLGKYKCENNENDIPHYFEDIKEEGEIVYADDFKFKKNEDVFWQDGNKIVADDFIWSWNHAINPLTRCPFKNLFFAIDGFDEQEKKSIDNDNTFEFYNGMKGLIKEKDSFFKIKLTKYCPYFDSLLACSTFYPASRHKMTENTGTKNEKLNDGWWQEVENICGCGAFKIKKFNNVVNGSIEMVKNDQYCFKDEVKIDGFTFELIVGQTAAENKFNSDHIDYNDNFDRTVIDPDKNNKELFVLENTLCSYFICFNTNYYNSFDKFIDKTYRKNSNSDEKISVENREKIRQKMVKILFLIINRYDLNKNISKMRDDSANGVVSNFLIEEYIPIQNENNEIIAQRDENGKLKTAFWYQRSVSEEIGEIEGKEVFNVIDRKNYEIKITHFKTNLFCKRSIKSDILKKMGVSTYFFYEKNEYSDVKGKEVQITNIKEAKKIAEEIGIKYDNGKFINFPKINYLAIPSETDFILRIKNYLNLFGIELDISFIDKNTSYTYEDSGLYEVMSSKWTVDFYDALSWTDIFATEHGMNFFHLGK